MGNTNCCSTNQHTNQQDQIIVNKPDLSNQELQIEKRLYHQLDSSNIDLSIKINPQLTDHKQPQSSLHNQIQSQQSITSQTNHLPNPNNKHTLTQSKSKTMEFTNKNTASNNHQNSNLQMNKKIKSFNAVEHQLIGQYSISDGTDSYTSDQSDDMMNHEETQLQKLKARKTVDGKRRQSIQNCHMTLLQINTDNFQNLNRMNISQFYQICKKISTNSFGAVYQVRNRVTNIERIMKVYEKNKLDIVQRKQLYYSGIVQKKLDHMNIIKVIEVIQNDESYFVIYELFQADELMEVIKSQTKISEEQAKKYTRQLLQLVGFMQSKKLILRDLRPEKIYLEQNSINRTVKVKDLFSVIQSDPKKNRKLKKILGNPYLVAPEMFMKSYSYEVDIWQIGVLLYMMIERKPPFDGKHIEELKSNILDQDVNFDSPIWTDISEHCKDLIKQMLMKDPQQRIKYGNALVHKWFNTQLADNSNLIKKKVMINMSKFQTNNQLHQKLLKVFIDQMMKDEEVKDIQKTFGALDTENNGSLSKNQLVQGYTHVSKSASYSQKVVDNLYKQMGMEDYQKMDYKCNYINIFIYYWFIGCICRVSNQHC